MNKKFVLLGIAAAASACVHAADRVEVYGILDVGVNRQTGMAGGSQNSVVSGIMDGSRLGFKGNEDLGGGYRAIFNMEHRIEADTGDVTNRPLSGNQAPDRLSQAALLGLPTAAQPVVSSVANVVGSQIGVNLNRTFWDRQIYVGLVTPVGAVLAGRQYTPAYETSALFDTLATQSALAVGQVVSFPPGVDIRVSNAVSYRAQKDAWSGAAMYAAAEGSNSTGRLIGGNIMYKVPAFSLGLGYNTRENELGQKSLTTLVAGATVTAGPGTVYLQAGKVRDDNPTGLSSLGPVLAPLGATGVLVRNAFTTALRQNSNLYHVGYRFSQGPNTVYVAYSLLDDRRAPNADTASYGLAYTYSISKRTDLNMVAVRFDNRNLGQTAPGQAGSFGGVTASAGTDSNSFSFGMRHRF